MSNDNKSNNTKLKLTTRGRYAVMAMVKLAERDSAQPVPLADVAQSGNISLSYLEQLFAGLRRNGLVKSYRGPGGGYILARPASEILVSDILSSAEDCVPARRASVERENFDSADHEQAQALWSHIGEILYAYLQHLSLEDVLRQRLDDHPMMNRLTKALA